MMYFTAIFPQTVLIHDLILYFSLLNTRCITINAANNIISLRDLTKVISKVGTKKINLKLKSGARCQLNFEKVKGRIHCHISDCLIRP